MLLGWQDKWMEGLMDGWMEGGRERREGINDLMDKQIDEEMNE